MVGFVDDGHIPVRLEQVFNQCRLRHQEVDGHDDVVALHERVRLCFILGHAHKKPADVAFIKQSKELVEAALHLDHPLVFERFRDNHERALDTAPRLERMPNHARLNRLSEAHFVREHQPRERGAGTCAVAKVILVRNHVHTRANHTTDRRRSPLVIHFHRIFMAQKITGRANIVIGQGLKKHNRSSGRNLRA